MAFPVVARAGAGGIPPLRVGLSRAIGGSAEVGVSCDAAFLVIDVNRNKTIAQPQAGDVYDIKSVNSGLDVTRLSGSKTDVVGHYTTPLLFESIDSHGVKIARVGPGGLANSVWHTYAGTITIRILPDAALSAINTVDLEDYLYGVLAPEMGADAPPEALKAQAVASRTFALKNRGHFAADGFDIDDSTRTEQYDGLEGQTPAVQSAVDATRGQVLTYNGELIDAYFCTDCGGVTAVDSDGDHPYLQAVVDAPAPGQPEYAPGSANHDWDLRFTQPELQALLNKDPRTRVSNFVSLSIDGFDASGRITTATISDNNGAMKTVTGPELRSILGYDTMKSTKVTLTVKANGDYVFHGNGWGHGFGMSQVGAIAMASAPYNKDYTDILTHYYVGVKLSTVDELKLADTTATR